MPDTTITAIPFVLKKPKLSLGTTGTAVDIACAANQVVVEADQDSDEAETFCGSYTTYKAPVWTITVTALQSFGTGGLWTALYPLAGTIVDFAILPDASKAVGPDNPEMRGKAYVQYPDFLNGGVNETNEFDVELGVQGIPIFATTAALGAEATEGGEGAETTEQQPVGAVSLMADAGKVDVDTAELERDMRQLAAGLDRIVRPVATATAVTVADKIRSALPKLTGRLAGSVTVTSFTNGAEVHYGGSVPYADYIDKRTGATVAGTTGCEQVFVTALVAAAEAEVRRL